LENNLNTFRKFVQELDSLDLKPQIQLRSEKGRGIVKNISTKKERTKTNKKNFLLVKKFDKEGSCLFVLNLQRGFPDALQRRIDGLVLKTR
jgi:hypothetical protein